MPRGGPFTRRRPNSWTHRPYRARVSPATVRSSRRPPPRPEPEVYALPDTGADTPGQLRSAIATASTEPPVTKCAAAAWRSAPRAVSPRRAGRTPTDGRVDVHTTYTRCSGSGRQRHPRQAFPLHLPDFSGRSRTLHSPRQGGGHWFEPSIAHHGKALLMRGFFFGHAVPRAGQTAARRTPDVHEISRALLISRSGSTLRPSNSGSRWA